MADLEISIDIDARGTRTGAAVAKSEIKGVADEARRVGEQLKAAGAMMQQFGSQLTSIGTSLTVAITAPLAAAGVAILKAGGEYEKALNIFQAVTKATGDEMTRAATVAKELGADLSLPATSAKDAALAMTELGKAGLTAAQAMDAAKGVLQLAAAGQLEEARAAEIAANALNAFHLEAKESTRVANLLAAAANASSAEVEDIALAMQQAGSSFATAKMPIEDMVVAIAALANAGIKGSDAGTSLKTFIQSLAAPSSKAAETMTELGVAVFDTSGKMNMLPEIISKFRTALAGLTDEQKAGALYKIFGSDAIRAAQILFNLSEEGLSKLKQNVTVLDAAAELANARMKGLSGAWEGFKSQMETVGITIYEVIKAPLTEFLQGAAQFAGQLGAEFEKLDPSLQLAAIAIAAFAAAIGPILIIAGSLIGAIGTIVSAVGAIVSAVGAAGGLAVVGPILLMIVAGIAQLVAAAAALYAAWQTNFGGIRELTAVVASAVKQAWEASLMAIQQLTAEVMAEVQRFWKENGEQITNIVTTLSDQIKQIWTAVVQFWRENNETIKAVASAIWDAVKTVIVAAIRIVGDVITAFLKATKGDWSGAWNAIKDILDQVWKAMVAIVNAGGKLLLGAMKIAFLAMIDLGKWVITEMTQIGANIVVGIANGISGSAHLAIDAAKRLAQSLPDWVRSILHIQSPSKVMYAIGIFVGQGLAEGIFASTDSATGAAESLGQRIVNSFKNMLGNLGQLFGGMGSGGSGGGRGILGTILGGLFGGGRSSGMGPGGTPMFNPNGGGSSSSGGGIFGNIFGNIFGGGGQGGGTGTGGNIWSSLRGLFGDRTGSLDSAGNVIVDGRSWGSKFMSSKALGGLATMLPFLGFSLGSRLNGSRTSSIMGGIGGAAAGLGIAGLAAPGALGAMLGTGALATAALSVFALAAAPLLILGAFFLSRNARRRKEEKIRNQGMLDAFEELKKFDTIIGDVKGLRMDPASGIAQGTALGEQVRAKYLEMANSLKDKKTRNHALADVSRIDAIITQKMAELRAAGDIANAAGDRQRRMLPEFAGGVYMSPQFMAFRRYNGMLAGQWTGRDVIPAMLARGEMVLNPNQQRRVIAAAGADVFKPAGIPGYAGGVAVSESSQVMMAPDQPINIMVSIEQDPHGMFQVAAQSDTGRKILVNVVNDGFSNNQIKTGKRGA